MSRPGMSSRPSRKKIAIRYIQQHPRLILTYDRKTTLDLTRFRKFPALLYYHDWNSNPIGRVVDLRLVKGVWTGRPQFHRVTEQSRRYKGFWKMGLLSAGIGGELNRKTNVFLVYEVSLYPKASNAQIPALRKLRSGKW